MGVDTDDFIHFPSLPPQPPQSPHNMDKVERGGAAILARGSETSPLVTEAELIALRDVLQDFKAAVNGDDTDSVQTSK